MPRLIFIFLDGVGIGRPTTANPFYAAGADYLPFYYKPRNKNIVNRNHPVFSPGVPENNGGEEENPDLTTLEDFTPDLPDNTPVKTIDARLEVEGMPMSATGQTALFTGINMPRLLNEHRDSYPDKDMRRVIRTNNIFTRLKRKRINVRFLNAYPKCAHLFTPEHIGIRDDGEFYFSAAFQPNFRNALSVTTCMMLSSYMKPFSEKDIIMERSLYHDFSNQSLRNGDNMYPLFSPEKAAEVIFNTSRRHQFLLYEFFQTDMYGHGFELEECIQLVRQLNRMVKRLVSLMDPEKDTLMITSDHGNLEESCTPLHTTNPVPLLAWGRRSHVLREKIDSLVDVTPAVVDFFLKV